jgi:hypothetical protein
MNLKKLPALTFNNKYLILLVLLLLSRIIILISFSFRFVDHDQITMWLGAYEMSHGNFYEPCFWGQSYNSMMEALFAVPLIKTGIPFNISIPIVTTLFSLFPFIFISLLFKKRGEEFKAILFLLIPLLITAEYDMITSMPRGFVTGIFVASFVFWSLFHKTSKTGWFIYGFCTILGLWLNPNTIYLSCYIAFFLFLENRKKPMFYVWGIAGAILPLCWWILAKSFYILHPSWDFHYNPGYAFNIKLLMQGFLHPNVYFKQLGLFHTISGWPVFFFGTTFLIIVLFYQRKKNEGFIFSFLFLCYLISLGITKVGDSHDNLFFPGVRFFISYPLLLALIISSITISPSFGDFFKKWFLIAAVLGFFIKTINVETNYNTIEKVGKRNWLAVDEVKSVKEECASLSILGKKYGISLMVFESYPDQLINYGCPCLEDSFPATIFPWYERRTWRMEEERNRIHKNILFVRPENKKQEFVDSLGPGIYIIRDNRLPTLDLLRKLKYEIR